MLEGSILQKLQDSHRAKQAGQQPLNFGVYYKNTLVALCHALEDAVLEADFSPVMITAFQQGKWYLEEADRYGNIAEQAQEIVLMAVPTAGFAEHPTSQRSNVQVVHLDSGDPVAQEWHLIIVSPTYTAMVLCQELSEADYGPDGVPEADQERKFYGLWTFEPALVLETARLAIVHIEQYDPTLQQSLAAAIEAIAQQINGQGKPSGLPTANNLGAIVARVVDYLQTSQADLMDSRRSYSSLAGLDDNLVSNELQAFLRVAQLIDQTDLSNPMAGAEVAALAETMGQLLDLPAWQLHRLRLAGLLHRMAFMQHVDSELSPGSSTRFEDDSPSSVPLTCPLVPGTQVLRRMQRLRAIATILTHQTEWWNGQGRPAGLTGDEIPIESRILGLVADFQQRVIDQRTAAIDAGQEPTADACMGAALAGCQAQQGDRWDPKLIDTLTLLVSGLQQGLDLPIDLPKIAAGMWLLDSHSEENLLNLYSDSYSGAQAAGIAETPVK